MAKNIVVCCDGTGNEIDGNLSNVLKLFRIAEKSDRQRVYYTPGVGTIAHRDPWLEFKQNARGVFGLATGWGLDDEILGAYRFLCEHYEDGDAIYLFGFSRGAYSVRALAGMIRMVGLLGADQLNVADYALTSYKHANDTDDFKIAWQFSRVLGGRHPPIKFIGLWDTVASVIVPRLSGLIPFLLTLPYTATNSSIEVVRQAMAIDERRRLFRLNRWTEPQPFAADPFDHAAPKVAQDVKQVWFAGVHSDIGGGYPEAESGLAKFPLAWMIAEASAHGLHVRQPMIDHLVFGQPFAGSKQTYVPPNANATLHDSMNWAWRLLEFIPKSMKLNEWPRPHALGCYLPNSEPRVIANPMPLPRLHRSVLDRQARDPAYQPINFPAAYEIEPWPHDSENEK